MTTDTPLEARLRQRGLVHPVFTVQAAERVGLPLEAACAMLEMESSGGLNEFGHDPGNPVQGGFVTKNRYLDMRYHVRRGAPSQGVGPCQLTSTWLQDEADHEGGCWIVEHNMAVGFHFLRQLRDELGDWGGYYRYNGSGPAASAYAYRATQLEQRWKQIITA